MVVAHRGSTFALNRTLELLGNTTDGVYAVDETHRIVLWNRAAERILGYAPEEVLGRPCYEVVAGLDQEGTPVCMGGCADMALAKAGVVVPSRDMVSRTKAGSPVWLNVTNIPMPSDCGGLSTVVHIFREVSARRHVEQLVERLASLVEHFAAFQEGQPPETHAPPDGNPRLTPREREVLRLLAQGANPAVIARELVISQATARKHVQNILRKFNLHTTLEAVAYASRHGLLSAFPIAQVPPS
ncbi:MAG: PAS domain S-box protein [Chloroflexi bacterium]|nr:PAS domain S-box protein [Chloroflexota bacterium]